MGQAIDFLPYDESDTDCKWSIKVFEQVIENHFNDWIAYRIFGHKKQSKYSIDMDDYIEANDIWGFLSDVAICYEKEKNKIKIIYESESESDSD